MVPGKDTRQALAAPNNPAEPITAAPANGAWRNGARRDGPRINCAQPQRRGELTVENRALRDEARIRSAIGDELQRKLVDAEGKLSARNRSTQHDRTVQNAARGRGLVAAPSCLATCVCGEGT
jgi:hypothetical protein